MPIVTCSVSHRCAEGERGSNGEGYGPSKVSRMKYASLVSGVSVGQRSARFSNASSETTAAAWSLILGAAYA